MEKIIYESPTCELHCLTELQCLCESVSHQSFEITYEEW